MAETFSPNPTTVSKRRIPISASNFFVGSNDDHRERAAARAARAAAIRRTSRSVNFQSLPSDSDPCLNKNQIIELFHRCIKLASENVMLIIIHQSPHHVIVLLLIFFLTVHCFCFCFCFCAQKINQKNTWDLDLIDHLTDIIRDEDDNDAETNFQMVSLVVIMFNLFIFQIRC